MSKYIIIGTYIMALLSTLKKMNEMMLYHIIIIISFAFLYYNCASDKKELEKFSSFESSLYFSCTTHFTIGFGDITPTSKLMRRLTMLHAVLAFAFMNI
jgi:uncharacterized membrane protein|tara:strand:- start:12 stop:308 length:297 start_codon:yes stop_codon:yes gene_type:complete